MEKRECEPVEVCHNDWYWQSYAENTTNGTKRAHKLSSRCERSNVAVTCRREGRKEASVGRD